MKENMEQKERVEAAPVQEQVVTKTKKPFYKKKGFWAAMIAGAAILVGGGYAYMRSSGRGDNSPETSGEVEETPRQQEHRDREDRGNRDWRRHGNERNNSNN